MPEQYNNYKNYRELISDFTKDDMTFADMPAIVSRIAQEPAQEYGMMDGLKDKMYSMGIGSGSDHTMVEKDRANARASLMRFIRKPRNLDAFKRLPKSQQEGIISVIKGGL